MDSCSWAQRPWPTSGRFLCEHRRRSLVAHVARRPRGPYACAIVPPDILASHGSKICFRTPVPQSQTCSTRAPFRGTLLRNNSNSIYRIQVYLYIWSRRSHRRARAPISTSFSIIQQVDDAMSNMHGSSDDSFGTEVVVHYSHRYLIAKLSQNRMLYSTKKAIRKTPCQNY